ncbi:PAS domain S-box protein [Rubrobacter radiotolerans]|uniref:PAS domain S-box protein n=1 Tax=Rubrobacter radiotolerans TaxID=42256 RepID=A0A023X0A6_RUBRA|nr:GAF domain-containing SpoIIE family protein phosphatase [Rubrobacter radiotolerans]AHY45611.1 PAS domain S-box protein [Rubrobacter radiotolerans]
MRSSAKNCRFLQNGDREQPEVAELKRAIEEGREYRAVLRNYKKTGEMFWNELYVSPVFDDEGNLVNFIGVQHDITERKVAEEALSEQEAQWRVLVENNPSFVALIDTEGKATYYNSGWLDYLGSDSEEVLRKEWPQKIHPEDRRELQETLRASYLLEESFSIPSMRIQRADGEYHWFSALVSPVRDDKGRVSSWITVSTDIEEIRAAEQALRESEERLRMAFRATSLGAWDYNPITDVLQWDDRTKSLFGYLPEFDEVSYRVFLDALHPGERERVDASVRRALDPESSGDFEESFRVVLGDGSMRWLYSTGRAFFDEIDGERRAYRFIGTILDVTARMEAEEERDLLLAREQLARAEAVSARRRLDFLVRADGVLLGSTGYYERLADTARVCVPDLADFCLVDVLNENGTVSQVAAAHADPTKQELLDRLHRHRSLGDDDSGIVLRVLESGRSEHFRKVSKDDLRDLASSEASREILNELGVVSLLSVPLLARGRTLGALTLVSSDRERVYDDEDLSLAESLAYRCALAVDNARLNHERNRIARTLQNSLLPRIPEVENLEVGVVYISAARGSMIGGDFYDLIPTEDDTLVALVGDVCGKGPSAAAVTALARYTIQAVALREDSPANALNSLNAAMLRQAEDVKFCTVACARFKGTENGAFELSVARGGHPAPLLLRASGEVERVSPQGRIIGIFDDPQLVEEHLRLEPGDALILYTDGIIEAKNAAGELLGEEYLVDLLEGSTGLHAEDISEKLRRRTLDFSGGAAQDDVAVLVLKVPEHR